MSNRIRPAFDVRQLELYSIASTIATNLEEHLPDFAAFKTKYNAAYITSFRNLINTAAQTPDYQQRNSVAESIRVELKQQAKEICNLWQRLKRYIIAAFDPQLHKPLLEAAGSLSYRKSTQLNWEFIPSLTTSAIHFMNHRTTDLIAGGTNMPPSFPATFAAASAAYDELYSRFIYHRQSREGTEKKIIINNQLYAQCTAICRDGAVIYQNKRGLRVKFTFSRIRRLISSSGTN